MAQGLWALIILALIALAALAFYFFIFRRDPARKIPQGAGIVSPADGKVIAIYRSKELSKLEIKKGLLGKIRSHCSDVADDCIIISIMMTPLDVHFQRSPIGGKVISIKPQRGTFLNAVATKNLNILENEKNEILIQGSHRVKVIQVAGFLARRIKCFVAEGQHVEKGQKIGFIDLGSQVTLLLPASVHLAIQPGQRVKAGETIIAQGRL